MILMNKHTERIHVWMKTVVMMSLLLCLLFAAFTRTAKAGTIEAKVLIDYLLTQVGNPYPENSCLQWVDTVLRNVGVFDGVYQSGTDRYSAFSYWNSLVALGRANQSYQNTDNIPLGADVFFNNGSYGHIGIYIGNGQFISAGTSVIIRKFWNDGTDGSFYGNHYLGWAWHDGVTVVEGILIDSTHFPDDHFREVIRAFDLNGSESLSDNEINLVHEINCEDSSCTDLAGIEYFTALNKLTCSFNLLTTLDVSKNTELTYLNCQINNIQNLDISANTNLEYLQCSHNSLTVLNVSNNAALQSLYCAENKLQQIDIAHCVNLEALDVRFNPLRSLDLRKNTKLRYLSTEFCHIKALDVNKAPKLREYLKKFRRETTSTVYDEPYTVYDRWIDTVHDIEVMSCDVFTRITAGSIISEPTEMPEPEIGDLFSDEKLIFKVTGTKTASFVGCNKPAGNITIPSSAVYCGVTHKITSVAEKALYGDTIVRQVTIGKNIKVIGKNAFASCARLTKVVDGSAVTTIKDSAFSGCKMLKTFPDMKKLQSIGNEAFKGCVKLAKITLSAKLKSIGKNAFNSCAKLKTIIIKTKQLKDKTVGENAFKAIYSKPTITCPKGMAKAYKKLLLKKGMPKNATFK